MIGLLSSPHLLQFGQIHHRKRGTPDNGLRWGFSRIDWLNSYIAIMEKLQTHFWTIKAESWVVNMHKQNCLSVEGRSPVNMKHIDTLFASGELYEFNPEILKMYHRTKK